MFKILPFFNSKVNTFILNKSLKKRYKVYLDLDMVFYDINFKQLNVNFVYDESEFFNNTIEGIPAFLKLQIPKSENFIYFHDLSVSKLRENEKYAILTYNYTRSYSTKFVAGVSSYKLESIKIKTNYHRTDK